MKIYFAGSVSGGRELQESYLEIIDLLKKYGEVLTEHIGDHALTNLGQTHFSPEEIHAKDTSYIQAADVVVAEVTIPSTGVGYELGFAEAHHKRVIVLYRPIEGKRLSAMVGGNKNFECIQYQQTSELPAIFDKLLK